jgi:hypothetical protein
MTTTKRSTVTDLLRDVRDLIERDGFRRAGFGHDGWGLAAALDAAGGYDLPRLTRASERIRKAIGQDSIIDWELEPGRTQGDVLKALRKAGAR